MTAIPYRRVLNGLFEAVWKWSLDKYDPREEGRRFDEDRLQKLGVTLDMATVIKNVDPLSIGSMLSAIWIALFHLSNVRNRDGKHEEAIHLIAEVMNFAEWAQGMADWLVHDEPDARELNPLDDVIAIAVPSWSTLEAQSTMLVLPDWFASDYQVAVESLLAHGRNVDWKMLLEDCRLFLADSLGPPETMRWFIVPPESPDLARRSSWRSFWDYVDGQFKSRLSLSDLRDFHEETEDGHALERLQGIYFSGGLWDLLPDQTQRSLVSAERGWLKTRFGRIESALNDLQRAVEPICFGLLWEPLRQTSGDKDLLEFKARDLDLTQRGHFPTAADYAWVCQQRFFRGHLDRHSRFSADDKRFLTRDLPGALRLLTQHRNQAEHHPNPRVSRESIDRIFREFLGVGCAGVIPRLIDVNAKLSDRDR